MKRLSIFLWICLFVLTAQAKVSLPQLFQSGMVLQRDKAIPVWGFAEPGERVCVSFKKKDYVTIADAEGRWRVDLPKQKHGGPYTLQVNDITIDDVLIGDVWLCSGQSNIDVTIERVYPQYPQEIDTYANDKIRLFRVQTDTDTHGPKKDVKTTKWRTLNKENAWNFSAVGYFLGREMYEKNGIPQGVIVNSVGGSPIQAWLDADTLSQRHPQAYHRLQFFQDDEMMAGMLKANQQTNDRWNHIMNQLDPGLSEGYARQNYDDSQWMVKNQYDNITGEHQYVGSFWARQQLMVDAAHAGKPARLLVGTLFDADFTFVNGQEVGRTYYQYPPRRYTIPAGLLKEGNNALTVRFITKGGNPHFIKDKPYKLIFEDGYEIPLSAQWHVHEGARMFNCPQIDVAPNNLPSVLYNAMLYPLAPYPLAGVTWYQGESNTNEGDLYRQMLGELVLGWRQLWNEATLPFVIVQLANFMAPTDQPQDTGWSHVREAQRLAARQLPHTALAVTIDLGEEVDIHPLLKREVAQRISMGFEKLLWDRKLQLSPEVVASETDGDKIVLTLDQPLRSDGSLQTFEVAAGDGRYMNAEAESRGNMIMVYSPVNHPVTVRYAWKNNPVKANAYGRNALPMSPFQLKLSPQR